MDVFPNPLRGEAACRIGSTDLILAVEFAKLATLCELAGCDTMELLYTRLVGFHPKTVIAALRVLSVHPDGDQVAREQAHKAINELSGADEPAFRDAITKALAGHIDAGNKMRGDVNHLTDLEKALGEMANGKKTKRPSRSQKT